MLSCKQLILENVVIFRALIKPHVVWLLILNRILQNYIFLELLALHKLCQILCIVDSVLIFGKYGKRKPVFLHIWSSVAFRMFILFNSLFKIARSYKTNIHLASIKHDTLKWQNTIKKVNVVGQILKYVGYTKPTVPMHVLYNLYGQLPHYHDFIFSLNVDRDGASLVSVGTKFHNWGAR